MRLSEYTDYTLRVLMYCAAHRDRLVTIGELAEHHGLSKNHLMKVVNDLARQGLLETTRGRGGGLRLLAEPETIRIGDVVRATETDFRLVECFDAATNACTLTPSCRLKHLFDDALAAIAAASDLVAGEFLNRRLGDLGEPLHEGKPGRLHRLATALTAVGGIGAALAGRNRPVAAASGLALVAGSACTRFAIFDAGIVSAKDPKYTVVPQRARAEAAAKRGEGITQPGGPWPS